MCYHYHICNHHNRQDHHNHHNHHNRGDDHNHHVLANNDEKTIKHDFESRYFSGSEVLPRQRHHPSRHQGESF